MFLKLLQSTNNPKTFFILTFHICLTFQYILDNYLNIYFFKIKQLLLNSYENLVMILKGIFTLYYTSEL